MCHVAQSTGCKDVHMFFSVCVHLRAGDLWPKAGCNLFLLLPVSEAQFYSPVFSSQ